MAAWRAGLPADFNHGPLVWESFKELQIHENQSNRILDDRDDHLDRVNSWLRFH